MTTLKAIPWKQALASKLIPPSHFYNRALPNAKLTEGTATINIKSTKGERISVLLDRDFLGEKILFLLKSQFTNPHDAIEFIKEYWDKSQDTERERELYRILSQIDGDRELIKLLQDKLATLQA